MKKVISALISIASIALPQAAIAQTVSYRGANNVDAVVTFEGAANAPFSAEIWTPRTANVTANACGLATVRNLQKSWRQFSKIHQA